MSYTRGILAQGCYPVNFEVGYGDDAHFSRRAALGSFFSWGPVSRYEAWELLIETSVPCCR
ncbi:MAG: hypothetical protein ACRD6N_08920, partial [Pyrinomonadaceae bacterium]